MGVLLEEGIGCKPTGLAEGDFLPNLEFPNGDARSNLSESPIGGVVVSRFGELMLLRLIAASLPSPLLPANDNPAQIRDYLTAALPTAAPISSAL